MDNPSALISLLTLERRFFGSSLSTALMLKRDSILAIKVSAITLPTNSFEYIFVKLGIGKLFTISVRLGMLGIIYFGEIGFGIFNTNSQ